MASDRPMTSVEISNFAAHLPDDLTEDQLNRLLAGVRDACNLAHTAGREEALATFRMRALVKKPDRGDPDEVRWHRAAMTAIGLWFERLETYVADVSSEYWRGYCDAQHEIALSARELMESLEAIQ